MDAIAEFEMNVLWTINVLQSILCTTQRFLNFKHKNEKCTKLSKYIWYLKSQGITPIVKWSIIKRVNSKTAANYCKLCLTEKFYIIQSLDDKNLLNKKSELVNKCRHQINLLLSNVKRNDSMDEENCILYSVLGISVFVYFR